MRHGVRWCRACDYQQSYHKLCRLPRGGKYVLNAPWCLFHTTKTQLTSEHEEQLQKKTKKSLIRQLDTGCLRNVNNNNNNNNKTLFIQHLSNVKCLTELCFRSRITEWQHRLIPHPHPKANLSSYCAIMVRSTWKKLQAKSVGCLEKASLQRRGGGRAKVLAEETWKNKGI